SGPGRSFDRFVIRASSFVIHSSFGFRHSLFGTGTMTGSVAALNDYLIVGALLFALGLVGFLARRNLIVMFLCAELMLQGVSLTLVAFSGFHGTWSGQVFAIFSLALAAAEAGIALALFVVLFRRGASLDVSIWQDLREADQPPITDDTTGAS